MNYTKALGCPLVLLSLLCGVAACGGGSGGGSNATATANSSALVPDALTGSSANGSSVGIGGVISSAPELEGDPDPAVTAGEPYDFQPVASDPLGEKLSFSVENLPSWAEFDFSTGRLSGTPSPADVGTYSNIVIRSSNSRATASLQPFSILVTQIGAGYAVVSWTPPQFNTDGSPLTDLAGYLIHFGRTAQKLDRTVRVSGPGVLQAVVENLSAGPWYFAVSSFNTQGMQSRLSGTGFKRVE